MPPLRERREDIPLLFEVFTGQAARRFQREAPPLTDAVRRYLNTHAWPGNVRELLHFAERFVLGVHTLPAAPAAQSATSDGTSGGGTLAERMDRYEAQLIRDTLAANGGNVRATLESLGIARKTFYDKLHRHGIERRLYVSDRTE